MIRIALLLVAAGAGALAQRPGSFVVIGPGGGGAQFNPTVSPHNPDVALVSCDMTGAYLTTNGGRTWRMFNLRGVVRFFTFDPHEPGTIYAQATGLWRSTNAGRTWRLVYPRPEAIRSIRMDDDHASERVVAEPDPLGAITALAIDGADSRRMYAAAVKNGSAALWVSKDGGGAWQREADLGEPASQVWLHDRSVLAAGAHGVTRITAGGAQRYPAPAGVEFASISGAGQFVYGAWSQGLYVSRDGGASWQAAALPGRGAVISVVATCPRRPETAYASYRNLELDGARWFGVAKTADGGRAWKLMWKESSEPAANLHDAWITARFGPGWGENPLAMGVAPNDPRLLYTTDYGRTLRTSDGGETWTAVYSRAENGGWSTTGLDVTTNYGYHFDPFDGKRQFISYTDIGLFRSENGGRDWVSSTEGVPADWVNTTYWMEFDPQVRGRAWAVMSYTHDLPRPKMWRRQSVKNYRGGVCRSDDGGRTWQVSNTGMPPTAPTHILLDPTSPVESRTLYVAAFGRGVYKSTDGGKSWVLKNNGIAQAEPFAWRLARASNGTLYLVVARRSDDGSIGNDRDGALYKSADGAEHWTRMALPEGVNGPNGLLVDARDDQRLYLAAWARAAGTHGEGGGIYLSTDGGGAWRAVHTRDQHVYDVTADSRHPEVLYACGFESSAWRSSDRGEHWERMPGFNFKWGHRVIPDPEDEGKVYITTFGGSVWHGRTDGDPDAVVDIETPEMRPGR